ncbi:oligosaccharide repeat unit polymerase [Flavobacterium galactosidilyticum]|uniref:O-antigen polymerase n=1 Tax=Flavobacterium galactosidilyticum TaxID=2893886 RepID=UPI001E52CF74|nr:O-antigen polymerase [Flavobacterium sp. F-340]UFH46684.1 oligosaccharide repeat unit polymerase [Flavobacterium sp. F-340]
MVHLALIFPLFLIIILRKLFSVTFLNPTGVFCGIWILILSLMQLMAPDFYFTYEAVFYILSFSLFFFIGEFLFFALNRIKINVIKYHYCYSENFETRLRKYTILISMISLIGSLFYLKSFVDHFGSLAEFLIAGSLIREDLFDGNISISSISIFSMLLSYSAINLAMVYYTKYGFRWFQMMPFVSVLISAFSQAARAGIVIMIFQIFVGKVFRLLNQKENNVEYKLLKPLLFIIPILLLIFSFIDSFRHQSFEISGDKSNSTINSLNVYSFGGVAGFTSYLDDIHKSTNDLTYGRYTFSSLYNILGISKAEAGVYDQYLNVSPSQTANIYSIFRPLLEDFGYLGLIFWALMLGVISNFVFRYSLRGSLTSTSLCISLYIYLMFSFIAPLTQFNSFLLSCILPPFIIQISKFSFKFKRNISL